MRTFLAAARELETEPGMLSASIGEGFPYADVAAHGDGLRRDRRRRRRRSPATGAQPPRATRLGDARPVRRRGARRPTRRSPRRSRRRIRGRSSCSTSATTSAPGTPGDSAVLLEALIRNARAVVPRRRSGTRRRSRATATVGARVDLDVGGKTDPLYGPPVRITGVTRAVGDDAWEDRRASGGWVVVRCRAGRRSSTSTAAGRCCSRRRPCRRRAPASTRRSASTPPTTGSSSPRRSTRPATATRWRSGFIPVDTPGLAASNLRRFTYHHRRRPMLPFEPDTTYE